MKKQILFSGFILTALITSCHKHEPCPNEGEKLKQQITGTWNQVGFKNDLFNTWSYTVSGPTVDITPTWIGEPYNLSYTPVNGTTLSTSSGPIYVQSVSDTLLFTFPSGDQAKLIKK